MLLHDLITAWQHDLIKTRQHKPIIRQQLVWPVVSWKIVTFLCPAPSIVVVIFDTATGILFMTSGLQRLAIDTDMTTRLFLCINQRSRPYTTKYLTFLQETIIGIIPDVLVIYKQNYRTITLSLSLFEGFGNTCINFLPIYVEKRVVKNVTK